MAQSIDTWPKITQEEFESQPGVRSLLDDGWVVAPCGFPHGEEDGCKGWQILTREVYEELKEFMPEKVQHKKSRLRGG